MIWWAGRHGGARIFDVPREAPVTRKRPCRWLLARAWAESCDIATAQRVSPHGTYMALFASGAVMDAGLRPSLPEFLAYRARHASDRRLALDTGGGFLGALLAMVWHGPSWFFLACAGVIFGAYGMWGIADRELGELHDAKRRALRLTLLATRIAAVVLAVLAVICLIFGVPAVLLGTWIS